MDGTGNRKVLWVREIRADNSDRRTILCVSDNYQDVHVGDVFTKCYDMPRQTPQEMLKEVSRPASTNCAGVELTVAAIEWPKGKTSQLLPSGHTGAIQFTGAESESIVSGSYLET